MPRYAGPDCLVVVWSHSGENEEALALYDIARERGCRLIVISSGGRLSEKAREDEVILYPAEAGLVSQPGASSVSPSSSISNPGASSVSGPESSAVDRKNTRLNSSHSCASRMPSSDCTRKKT